MTKLTITLGAPLTDALVRDIERIPSIHKVDLPARPESLSPLLNKVTVILEPTADPEETAYLLESLPGIRSAEY